MIHRRVQPIALLISQSFPRTQTSYCSSWWDTPDDAETQRGRATRPNVDGHGVLALQLEGDEGSSLRRRRAMRKPTTRREGKLMDLMP
jgi:hypothetical protein